MVRLALFLAGSAGILLLSWRSLRDSRAHGFYRFFGFELLLALVLTNSPSWFEDPAAPRQIAAWSLGVVSLLLAIEGFRLLRILGRPSPNAASPTNLAFENTTTLVTAGVYRFIRHPLYASLLALAWGAYLKDPFGLTSAVLALAVSGFFIATAMIEERENVSRFGSSYLAYMRHTKRFVPFLF